MALTLESSTISEFHGSLMMYYELVKDKQRQHTGDWTLSKGTLPIPDINISKESIEDRTILRDRDWGTKAEWRDTMFAHGFNKENTKLLWQLSALGLMCGLLVLDIVIKSF